MRPSVWGEVVRPMLADRKGWATFIGTPRGHNGFYEKWREAQADPESWYSVALKASETGLLSAQELTDAAKTMSEDQYLQEFECSFEAAIQGAYFASQMRRAREEGRIGKLPLDPARPVNTFWDIGKNDLTAIWFHQNRGQMHHLLDYYENAGEGVEFYARVLRDKEKERGWAYGQHFGPHDLDNSHWVLPGRETIQQAARNLGIDFWWCRASPTSSTPSRRCATSWPCAGSTPSAAPRASRRWTTTARPGTRSARRGGRGRSTTGRATGRMR